MANKEKGQTCSNTHPPNTFCMTSIACYDVSLLISLCLPLLSEGVEGSSRQILYFTYSPGIVYSVAFWKWTDFELKFPLLGSKYIGF